MMMSDTARTQIHDGYLRYVQLTDSPPTSLKMAKKFHRELYIDLINNGFEQLAFSGINEFKKYLGCQILMSEDVKQFSFAASVQSADAYSASEPDPEIQKIFGDVKEPKW